MDFATKPLSRNARPEGLIKARARLLGTTAIVVVAAGLSGSAMAADWVGGTATYETDANWNPAATPDSAGETATFSGNGGATVTLSTTVAPNSWAISGAKSYTIGGGTANLGTAAGLTNTSTVTQTVNTVIGGASAKVTQNGAGTLVLGGANTYGGGTTISAGTISIDNDDALGTGDITLNGGALLATADVTLDPSLIGWSGAGGTIAATAGNTLTLEAGTYNRAAATTMNFGRADALGTVVIGGPSGVSNVAASASIDFGTVAIGSGNAGAQFFGSPALTGTTVAAGATLDLNGFSTNVQNLAGAGDVTNNFVGGTAILNVINSADTTFTGVIVDGAGAIGLVKLGSSKLTLAGANTYSGGTEVSDGTLILSGGSAIDDNGALTVSAPGVLQVDTAETVGKLDGSGNITLNATLTSGQAGFTSEASGIISGTGGMTVAGTGLLILSGANTYDGLTTVQTGAVLVAASNSALGSTAAGTTVASGGALQLTGGITVAEALTLNGTGEADDGALRSVSGNNTVSGAITLGSSGVRINADAGQLSVNGGITGTNTNLTLGGAGNILVGSTIGTGTGTLTKDGAGTATLTGANSFTGATTISAGSLNVTGAGSLASTAVNVTAGTLTTDSDALGAATTVTVSGTSTFTSSGTDTYTGIAQTGGTVNGTGVQTLTGAFTQSGGSTGGSVDINAATFTQSGGATIAAGTTVTSSGAQTLQGGTIAGTLDGAGAVTVNTGITSLTGAGAITTATAIGISAGGTLASDGDGINDAATVTNAGTFTITGAETIGGLQSAGAVSVNGNTLTAATATITGGAVTATAGGKIITDSFTQSGGTVNSPLTVAGTTAGSGFYRLSGGTTTATINSFSFGQTGGTSTGATINSAIKVTAIGGAITAIGPGGVAASNSTVNGVDVTTTAAGDISNGSGIGIDVDTSGGTGPVTMTLAGTTSGTIGINVAGGTGLVDIDVKDNVTGTTGSGIEVGSNGAITVRNTGGSGVTVQGAGNGMSLSTSATTGAGILVQGSSGTMIGAADGLNLVTAGVDIDVIDWDRIQGNGGDGIDASSNGGDLTVSGVLAVLGTGGDGIFASSGGVANAGDISVQGSGTGYDFPAGGAVEFTGIVGTNGNGITADATGTTTGGNITVGDVTANGDVTGSGNGMDLRTNHAGTITVVTGGDTTGTAGTGLSTIAETGATSITVSDGDAVLGGGTGISSQSSTGAVTVNLGEASSATGTSNNGIGVATTTGLVTLQGAGIQDATVSGGTNGIAVNTDGGNVVVDNLDSVEGLANDGIFADTRGGITGGTVEITDIKSVTGGGATDSGIQVLTQNAKVTIDSVDQIEGGDGIFVQTNGGDADITNNGTVGDITGDSTVGYGVGVNAQGAANGGNVTITGNGRIDSAGNGIAAFTNFNGTVLVTTGGTVVGSAAMGIQTSAVDGLQTINVGHDVFAGLDGVNAHSDGAGNIIVNQTAAKIDGAASGINASVADAGTGDIDVDVAATVTSTTTGITVTGINAGTSANVDIAAAGSVHGDANAIIAGTATFSGTNLGSLTSDGNAFNATFGNATFKNSGTAEGNLASAAASSSNAISNIGTWTVIDGGTSTLDGLNDTLDTDGTFNMTGATINGMEGVTNTDTFNLLGGSSVNGGTFVNYSQLNVSGSGQIGGSATNNGTIDLTDAGTNDKLTVTGAYGGNGTVKVDLDVSTVAGTSDQLIVGGASSGSTVVDFSGASQYGALANDTLVLGNVAGLTASETGLVHNVGLVQYDFEKIGADYFVTSQLNLAPIGGIVGGISTAQSLINAAVNRPSSAFVTTPIDVDPDTCAPGGYGRLFGGASNAKSTTTAPGSDAAESEVDLTYGGAQIGVDFGCFNIKDSGASVNVGLLAGVNTGKAKQDQSIGSGTTLLSDNDFDSRYVGVYATYVKESFFADAQVTFDSTSFDITSSLTNGGIGQSLVNNQSPDSDRVTISSSAGYAFAFDDISVVPSAGFAYSRTSTDSISLVSNQGRLDFNDLDTFIGFASVAVAKTIILPNETSAIQPFVTATIYNDFGKDQQVTYSDNINDPVQTSTQNIGTFGELSLGMNYRSILDPAQTKLRELSASIRGDLTFSDRLVGGRITGQLRLQF